MSEMTIYYFYEFTEGRKVLFFFSSRRRHTRLTCEWSSDVCSSDLANGAYCASKASGGSPVIRQYSAIAACPWRGALKGSAKYIASSVNSSATREWSPDFQTST